VSIPSQRAQDDVPFAEFANGSHYRCRVATQPVDADDDDGVTGSGVVQERRKTRTLLARGGAVLTCVSKR
jgi:hypothetical protein